MRAKRFAIFRSLTVLGLLLCLVAPVQAQELLNIKHAQGLTQVQKLPKTGAVLDWATLDTMAVLGVQAQAIPNSNILPPMLSQYEDARFVRVGTLFEPDYEALKNLKPDLIILGRRAAGHYAEVAKFGPTLDLTPNPKDLMGSVVRNTEILGQIFDREQQAAELTAKLQASVKQLQALSATQGKGLTLLTSGGKMSAFGIGTRFGMIHDVFGVEPAVADLKVGRHGQAVSYEFLLEANPSWLFVMDRDAAIGREGVAAQGMMDNELVQATEAGAKGQIVYLEPVSWYLLDNSGLGGMQTNVERLLDVFSK